METVDRIKEVLDTIRPFLESDGGDVEFVRFEDGSVYLKLLGACSNCNLSDMTLEGVIQEALTFEIPEVIKVVNIGE